MSTPKQMAVLQRKMRTELTQSERELMASTFPARTQAVLDRAESFNEADELRQSAAQHYVLAEFYENLVKLRYERSTAAHRGGDYGLPSGVGHGAGGGRSEYADPRTNVGYDAIVTTYRGTENTPDSAEIDVLVQLAMRARQLGDDVTVKIARLGLASREAESVTYTRAVQMVAVLAAFCEAMKLDWGSERVRAAAQAAVAAAASAQSDVMMDPTGMGVMNRLAHQLRSVQEQESAVRLVPDEPDVDAVDPAELDDTVLDDETD